MSDIASDIRKAYPHPVALEKEGTDGAYCVGGALGAYMGDNSDGFPDTSKLTCWLMEANPALQYEAASNRAAGIIEANDCWDMEAAWRYLAEALTATGSGAQPHTAETLAAESMSFGDGETTPRTTSDVNTGGANGSHRTSE